MHCAAVGQLSHGMNGSTSTTANVENGVSVFETDMSQAPRSQFSVAVVHRPDDQSAEEARGLPALPHHPPGNRNGQQNSGDITYERAHVANTCRLLAPQNHRRIYSRCP